MPPLIQLYKRRDLSYPALDHLHACGFDKDLDEDPRLRGVLRSANCRRHRERLRSSRQSNILQGFSIVGAVLVVVLLLIYLGIEMDNEQILVPEGSSLLMTTLRLVGLDRGEKEQAGKFQVKARDIPEDDSCNQQNLDLAHTFRLISKQVLNQEQALARMERALTGEGRFHSVALLGPSGVGKTLTVNALRQSFPWPTQAHSYSWATGVSDEVMKFRLVRQFADGLSNCGVNLLIIDNLSTCDHGLVPIYNRLIREREGELDRNQTVLVVYVFTLEKDVYWEQFELLQQQLVSADTTIVNFRFLARDDLMDCLANELEAEDRYLSRAKESLILDAAMRRIEDVGCKGLRLLVLEHGEPCGRKPALR